MNREFIKAFLHGLFSVFNFVPDTYTYKERRKYNLLQYFYKTEKYINSSFKKIRTKHEKD